MHPCDSALDSAVPPAAVAPRRQRVTAAPAFTVDWARCEEDVRAAQRLRYRVFAREMGARLVPPPGTTAGLDVDRFDAYCDHLLVRATDFGDGAGGGGGAVVGTYRLLSPAQARRAGGYYGDAEFDLRPLAALRPRAVELGRSCVDAGWRHGGVIMVMWTALCRYMVRHQLDTMIGCASISLADGLPAALALWEQLRHTHLAEAPWRVTPWRGLPMSASAPSVRPEAPPLIKGYLRCGARVLGPPALDPAFNTADLPMMLRLAEMAPRYRRHFLGDG